MINSDEEMLEAMDNLDDGEYRCLVFVTKKNGEFSVDVCGVAKKYGLAMLTILIGLGGEWIHEKIKRKIEGATH